MAPVQFQATGQSAVFGGLGASVGSSWARDEIVICGACWSIISSRVGAKRGALKARKRGFDPIIQRCHCGRALLAFARAAVDDGPRSQAAVLEGQSEVAADDIAERDVGRAALGLTGMAVNG